MYFQSFVNGICIIILMKTYIFFSVSARIQVLFRNAFSWRFFSSRTFGAGLILIVLDLQATSLTFTVKIHYTTDHGDAEVEHIGMVNGRQRVSQCWLQWLFVHSDSNELFQDDVKIAVFYMEMFLIDDGFRNQEPYCI